MTQLIADLVRRRVLGAVSGAALVGYMPAGAEAAPNTLQVKLGAQALDLIVDFGAAGDGVTDDTTKIAAALNYCSTHKRRLYVPGGRDFLMTRITKSGHYTIDIFSDPANRARFVSTEAAALAGARQFEFVGPEDITGLTLVANIGPNNRKISLGSVAGISAGMVIRISSNTLWPYDHRDSYCKGEIHEIITVDAVLNQVTVRDSTRDTYLTSETINIAAWWPNTISLENLDFVMPGNGVGTGGVQFTRARSARVNNCRSFGNTFYQFMAVHSIDTHYNDIEVGPGGLGSLDNGYGIYDTSNLGTMIRGLTSYGLRAAYDSHTTSTGMVPNRDATIDGFVIRGGGAFFPDTSTESRGLGMHGPSENVRFINGFITDTQSGIRVRGKDTFIQNVTFSGRMDIVVACSHGTGLVITDCKYDAFNYPNKVASLADIVPASRIDSFVDFGINNDIVNAWQFSSPVIIHSNTVLGIDRQFIKLTCNNEYKNLSIRNNVIQAIPGTSVVDYFYLFNGPGDRYVYSSECVGNTVEALNGSYKFSEDGVLLGYSANPAVIDRGFKLDNRSWIIRVTDDAVARMRFDLVNGFDRPNIWIAGDGDGTKLVNIQKDSATLTAWAGSTFSNIAGYAAAATLNGTTGVDGNITIGLTGNGDFYLENRSGSSRTYRISLAS